MYNLLKKGNTCINKSFKEDIKMRRNNRPINNEKSIMQNKILMYSIIGVGFLTIVLVGLLMYSRNLNEDIEQDVLDFGDMTNGVSDNITNSTNSTNTESVSTDIGKSVNEALNNNTNTNVVNNSNTTSNNTQNQTNNTTKKETTSKELNTSTTNVPEEQKETKQETKQELSFERPVEGEIIKTYAKDNLVYSETLQEWTTHLGIDIKADKTTVVKAAEAGTVKTIKNDPRYGLTIIIEHDQGYQTVYANLLSSEFVIEGEKVDKGQSIGTVGNTATFEIVDEPHLHFEILKDGVQIDPTTVMK